MPSTVGSLLAAVGLEPDGCVPWNAPLAEARTGVYIVSLTASTGSIDGTYAAVPLSDAALDELLGTCPDLTLDSKPNPTKVQLAARIGTYWLADECVMYIGLAGQSLRTRVRQYYTTPIGAAKPHKGGWWLKTLEVLNDLHVHYAATDDIKDAEEAMLRAFAGAVSDRSRAALPEGEPLMPFANLRDGDWRRRSHGIGGATSATTRGIAARRARAAATSPQPIRSPAAALGSRAGSRREPPPTPHPLSQRITAKDIESGQVRIPGGATKAILPRERQDISVRLRGRSLTSRWDPRYGPPERSGVIRVGKASARELLQPGDILAVRVRTGTVELE